MNRTTITLLAAAATVAGLTACVPIEEEAGTGSAATTTWSYTPPSFTAPKTTVPVKPDPYSTTGTWLVPGDIAPGTYRIQPIKASKTAYYAVCATYACDPGPGIIKNDLPDGPGVLVVPESAVAVELKNLTLTPMAGA